MGAPRTAKVSIELDPPGEPICGELEDPYGESARFSGWIGLVAAVEAARAAALQAGPRHGSGGATEGPIAGRSAPTGGPSGTYKRNEESMDD